MAPRERVTASLELSDNFLYSTEADRIIADYARTTLMGGVEHYMIPALAEQIIKQREKRDQQRAAAIRTPEEVPGISRDSNESS